jgi:hypothetical protein
MAKEEYAAFDVGHPAPARERIGLWVLFFGLGGAPLAWAVQLVAISSIASVACIAGDGPKATPPGAPWADAVLIAVNLAALVAAAVALAMSWRNLDRTGHELAHSPSRLMEAGEGRSRFLSVWGIWTGILFMLAIAFNTLSVLWAGLCAG